MNADSFAANGFAIVPNVLSTAACTAIAEHVASDSASSGARGLLQHQWCVALAKYVREHAALSELIPEMSVAVQCTYFEKSADHNWLVPIHQDLSIPVAERVEALQLHGWSEKEGLLFVQPPMDVLEKLIAVRVHLDACGANDGQLQVVPGSHLCGHIQAAEAILMRSAATAIRCSAAQGDALVMRPLLLHASSKSVGTSRRRVLHFVYGPRLIPHGLQWQYSV